jgi:L-histidine Nalpha-methyltransferase
MHLVAEAPQRVRLRRLDLVLDFAAGESIWTESSYKYTRESVGAMLRAAALAEEAWFTGAGGRFALVLARAEPPLSAVAAPAS